MNCPVCGHEYIEHEFLEGNDSFPEIMCTNEKCPSYNYGILCWLSDYRSQKESDDFLELYIKSEILIN